MIVILPYHGHFSKNSKDNLIPSKIKKKQDRDKENDSDRKKRNQAKPKTLLRSGSFASYGKGAGWLILKKILVAYSYQKCMQTNTPKMSHSVSQIEGMLDSARYTYA